MTSQPRIAVGIGNTTVKLGLTECDGGDTWPAWRARHEIPTRELVAGAALPGTLPEAPVEWLVASVHRRAEAQLRDWVTAHRPADRYYALGHADLPLAIRVDAPERVGLDRLTAAVAVNRLRGTAPAIFIDAGTALTVNLVGSDGAFEGGVILPGFGLTARALSEGTDQLPLVLPESDAPPPPLVGKSTQGAILSGLFWGNVGAVRELVARFRAELAEPAHVYVTGGDTQRLTPYIDPEARFVPDLVLAGIVFSAPA